MMLNDPESWWERKPEEVVWHTLLWITVSGSSANSASTTSTTSGSGSGSRGFDVTNLGDGVVDHGSYYYSMAHSFGAGCALSFRMTRGGDEVETVTLTVGESYSFSSLRVSLAENGIGLNFAGYFYQDQPGNYVLAYSTNA